MPLKKKNSGPPAYAALMHDGVLKSESPTPSALTRDGVVIPQCEHIRMGGSRCGSPALRGKSLCYFHDYTTDPRNQYHGGVPLPEDAASIQVGLSRVIRNLEAMPATPKTYALMLYALQTASANLKRVREEANAIAEEADAAADAQKPKPPSLLDLMKEALGPLEPPPEGCVE